MRSNVPVAMKLERDRAAQERRRGRRAARAHAGDALGEQPVIGHRQRDPGGHQDVGVDARDGGDDHDHPDDRVAPGAEHHLRRRAGGERLVGQARHRQHVEERQVQQQVDADHQQDAAHHRARHVAPRIPDLAAEVDQPGPAVVRVDHACMATASAVKRATPVGTSSARPPGGRVAQREDGGRPAPTSTSPLSRLVSCWTASPHSDPAPHSAVSPSTAARATAVRGQRRHQHPEVFRDHDGHGGGGGAGEIQSLQPTMNPGYSPSARRTNTYWPPDLGSIAPSSASEMAPSSA